VGGNFDARSLRNSDAEKKVRGNNTATSSRSGDEKRGLFDIGYLGGLRGTNSGTEKGWRTSKGLRGVTSGLTRSEKECFPLGDAYVQWVWAGGTTIKSGEKRPKQER